MPRPNRPIPLDPDGQNDDRARWAEQTLGEFMIITGSDPEDALCDLLCDLKHWCYRNNTSFGRELERACRMYKEDTQPLPPGETVVPRPHPNDITAQDLGANPEPEPPWRADVNVNTQFPTPYTPPDQEVPF